MGELGGFLAEIRRQAQQRALAIEQEAEKQASAILAETASQIQQSAGEVDRKAARQAEQEARQIRARGELEARRLLLTSRETLLERVWKQAEARLRALVHSPNYRDVLKRLALEAAGELAEREITLAADATGHDLLTPEVLESWSAESGITFRRSAQPAAAWGGLLASSGRIQCDNTFATRLALTSKTRREDVFQLLTANHHADSRPAQMD